MKSYTKIMNCKFVTQDDKAILLKCQTIASVPFITYDMYFIHYLRRGKLCNVLLCTYSAPDAMDTFKPPSWFTTDAKYCPDEKDISEVSGEEEINLDEINCDEEFIKRGWDKYLPDFPKSKSDL